MKNISCLVLAVVFLGFVTSVSAITISDDFSSPNYNPTGSTLGGKDGGSNWEGSTWQITTSGTAVASYTTDGSSYTGMPQPNALWHSDAPYTGGNKAYVKREWSTPLDITNPANTAITFDIRLVSLSGPLQDNDLYPYGAISLGSGNDVISIGFLQNSQDTGKLKLVSLENSGTNHHNLLDGSPGLAGGPAALTDRTYHISIDQVALGTYQVNVNDTGDGGSTNKTTTVNAWTSAPILTYFGASGESDGPGGGTANTNFIIDNISITGTQAVPEPSTVAFFGIGLVGLAGIGMKKLKAQKV
ncbi:MAG TPA: PEP-CTERM sorting domain-containing protein [bacterium]|nr:PEP-CTERM sorting domain-containing protein [bacterium]